MRRKLLYSVVVLVIMALLIGAAVASLSNRPDLAQAALAGLAAAACLMLVERRWALQQSAGRLDLIATRVQGVARRSDLRLATKPLKSVASRVEGIDQSVHSLAQRLDQVEQTLDAISRRNQNFHTEVRTGLRRLRHEPLVLQIAAQLELQDRFSPRGPLVAAGAWALSPTVAVEVVDVVVRKKPELVVECGSGISTIWLGYAVRESGRGRVVAFEHDETYLRQTQRMVRQHGLDDVVEVRHTPMTQVAVGGSKWPWYDVDLADLDDIGVLLVDGPPAATGESARYPALPVLRSRLVPGATVVLDDIIRKDEQGIVYRWLKEDDTLELGYEVLGGAVVLHVH